MKKITINRFDLTAMQDTFLASGLACGFPDGPWPEPELVSYVRNQNPWRGITYFTDKLLHLAPQIDSDIKVAVLCEPEPFMPSIYKTIKIYERFYDLIFTYNDELLKRDPTKYIFSPAMNVAIEQENFKMHDKIKLLSMIYSNKKFLKGHKLRFAIAEQIIPKIGFCDKIDLFGTGTKTPLTNKSSGCVDYMFQIAVENEQSKNYFTEKLLDCFATGCIPIYWGCSNLEDFFDTRGILTFNTSKELVDTLNSLDEQKYHSMLEYAKNNFELAKDYCNPDDKIFSKIKEKIGHKIHV